MRRARPVAAAILLALCASSGGAQQPSAANAALADRFIAASTDAARVALMDEQAAALSAELQTALSNRANELRRANKPEEATNAYFGLKGIADRRGDKRAAGMALVGYSAIPGQRADYAIALKVLADALAIGESIQNNEVIAAALANLAIVYRLTGDYQGSIDTNKRSLAIAIAGDDRYTQGRVYSNIGLVYMNQGHYREALEAYDKSLVLKRATSDAADVATTLSNIGIVHELQGNLDLSLDYYQRALAEHQKLSSGSQAVGIQLGNIGTVYREMGRLDLALENFQRALDINQRNSDQRGIATQLYNVASILRRQGRKDEALASYRKSLAIREPINDRAGIIESLHAISNMLAESGQFADALTAVDRAVAIGRDLKSNDLLWEPLKSTGDIKYQTHDLAGAEAAYRLAIDTIETLRSEVAGGAESRRRFFEDKLEAYHHLAATLLDEGRQPDALAVVERARGRVLFDVLDSADVAVRPLTDAERERQQSLERNVVAATARRDAEQIRKARLALDEVRDALDARYPVRRLARGDAQQPDPRALAADLLSDPRAAIAEYAVTGSATYLFVLTRTDGLPAVTAFKIPVTRDDLRIRAAAFNRKLGSRALDFHVDARALYDTLLKPARIALAGHTQLVIVPDDALWTIPFDALEPTQGTAVIDEATIAYAPSIAVLHAMHERRAALTSKGGAPRLVVAADPASDLPRIPDAVRQAAALTTLYGAGTRSFVGAAASEPAVRGASGDATVLHFATHGVVDDANPMYSFLQLTKAKPGEDDARVDGRLEAWEIVTLKLDAAVAVLTACDTARGKIRGGEGVIGLAWAFFAAGTPATVVSLWQLDSTSATTLTLAFHRRLHAALLKGNGRVAENLHAAALEMRRDPRFRHPFYWAGFVAVGDAY